MIDTLVKMFDPTIYKVKVTTKPLGHQIEVTKGSRYVVVPIGENAVTTLTAKDYYGAITNQLEEK